MSKGSIFNIILTLIAAVIFIFIADDFGSVTAIAGYVLIGLAVLMVVLALLNPVEAGYRPELSEAELAQIRQQREEEGLVAATKSLREKHRKLGLQEATQIVKEA